MGKPEVVLEMVRQLNGVNACASLEDFANATMMNVSQEPRAIDNTSRALPIKSKPHAGMGLRLGMVFTSNLDSY